MCRKSSRLAVLAIAVSLAGCGLTPAQKFGVVASVLIVGAVAAHQQDRGKPLVTTEDGRLVEIPCNPDGTC